MRHFNKETGPEGSPYIKKTDEAMCDEMKKDKYMEGYVMEAGKTSKCNVQTLNGCGDRESKYIAKMRARDPAKLPTELTRLTKMSQKSMKPHLLEWVNNRMALLGQLIDNDGGKAEL